MAKIDFEDDANYNRLNVLVFNRPLNIVDKKMLGFLQTDPEMQDAIFTWTIDGAYEFLEHGLKKPAIVDAATHQYQRMMNPLNWFLNEFCIKDETARTPASEVYERFKHVAELLPLELRASVKKELRGQKSFNKTFKKLVNFTRFNDRMYYLGIKIPLIWSEIDDEDEDVYMRKLSVDSADCVDSEGNFQKSLRNILAYRDFRKKYSLSTLSTSLKRDASALSEPVREQLVDQATLALKVKEVIVSLRSAHNIAGMRSLERSALISAIASLLEVEFQESGYTPDELRRFVERLSREDQEIDALLLRLTKLDNLERRTTLTPHSASAETGQKNAIQG
jgi:hypothetical protein